MLLLPYGADLNPVLAAPRFTERSRQMFRVLYVGQIIPLKGIHHLIRAFLALRLPQSELVLIGGGDARYQAVLKSLVPAAASVRFTGQLPRADVEMYYQNSDVFILPSLSEGSALVVYEAMAAGLPVITTPSAGSVVRDGLDGFIVPARNSEALQDKILFLYRNADARIAMGHSARSRAQEFTWGRYRERLLEVYDRILLK
jgi:glycosyltransferase involved in cell wall biosynthesis